jgi:hypothetical protein
VLQGHPAQAGATSSWPEDKEQLPDTQGKEGFSCQEEVTLLPGGISRVTMYLICLVFCVTSLLLGVPFRALMLS